MTGKSSKKNEIRAKNHAKNNVFFHRFQLRGGNLRPPDPPYNVEGNERTESRGWGKVKVIVYNIIVAKRIVSTSHPTCKNFSKFSIVFNA